MKRLLTSLLMFAGLSWGQITTIPNAAQILGLSGLNCSLGICTVEAPASSASTFIVKASAGQGSLNLQEWKSAAGTAIAYVGYDGTVFGKDLVVKTGGALLMGTAWDLGAYRVSPGLLGIRAASSTDWGSLSANNLTAVALATPSTPVITQGGTGGATPYGYKIACLAGDATTTAASVEGTTATGNATLSATDYNIVTFTPSTGKTSCDVFRTTGGATQGKIGNVTVGVLNDTGLAASGAAPTVNGTGGVNVGGNLAWATDNTADIGTSSLALRPRDVNAGRYVSVGTSIIAGGGNSQLTLTSPNGGSIIFKDSSASGIVTLPNSGTVVINRATNSLPGGTVPAWKLLQLAGLANGAGGCTNATGCWSVNGGTAVAQTAGLTQDVVLEALPAKAQVSDWRIKTNTICTGATTAKVGLGTTASNVLFRAQTYDIGAAVSDTNLTTGPTAGAGSNTAAATNLVASLITTVENVDAIADTCIVDFWVLYGVLP